MRQALELALEALQFALHVGFPESSESQIKKGEKAYQQHRAAITAIMATLDDLEQEIYENTRQFVSRDVMEWMLKRYYTTPPQRKPLTDEQIEQLEQDTCAMEFPETARAIEAAHGIKE